MRDVGRGTRDTAAADAGGGCSAPTASSASPHHRPRTPAGCRPAPDGRGARGSAGWRGRPGKEPWPAARAPSRRPGASLRTRASVRGASEPPHQEPTLEAKQKRRTGKEGISQKTGDQNYKKHISSVMGKQGGLCLKTFTKQYSFS